MRYSSYLKEFLRLSIPVILGQVGTVVMGITDMIMLGQIGKKEMAAVGVANQVYFLFMVFGFGTMAAITPLVAASKGAKHNRECGEILRTGIELSFITFCHYRKFLHFQSA
jgi:multidrug resistance protein, MATE family